MVRLLLAVALAALCVTAGAESQPAQTPTEAVLELVGGPVNNMKCGIPPIPPIGCRVGACVCDQNGNNCQWTFACG